MPLGKKADCYEVHILGPGSAPGQTLRTVKRELTTSAAYVLCSAGQQIEYTLSIGSYLLGRILIVCEGNLQLQVTSHDQCTRSSD